MKTNIITITLFSFMVLLSCKKDKSPGLTNACGVSDPIDKVTWLSELKQSCNEDDICKVSVFQALYNGDTVFYTFLSGPLCDPAFNVTLLDCEGNVIKEYHEHEFENFAEEVDSIHTIFTCWD
jgi:hypothetical protein